MKSSNLLPVAVLAMLFALSMGMPGASAETYEACPDAAQVDNAWWYPSACNGGIFSFGSLYLKWAITPFSNSTSEITSASLTLSTRSRGTDIEMFIWNGYSFTSLSGGRIDFMGNYVYDITKFPGLYTDDSIRIRIVNRGAEKMDISSLKLGVTYESTYRTLKVRLRDCGSGTRIRGAEVAAGDAKARTDSDGIATFTLVKGNVYEVKVTDDDFVEQKTRIFLSDDAEIEMCTVKQEIAGVDLHDLEVEEDGVITFSVENIGNFGDYMTYMVYVNDIEITSGTVFLEEGEEEDITRSYDFPPGRNKVTARAVIRNYEDRESMAYCVKGATQNFVCSGNKVLREVIKDGCVSNWVVYGTCEGGCSSGKCGAGGGGTGQGAGACGAIIASVGFADHVFSSELQSILAKVKNPGPSAGQVEAKLFVDGSLEDSVMRTVQAGGTESVTFQFMLASGVHAVRVETHACGRVTDSVSQEIVASPRPSATVQPAPQVPEAPPQKAPRLDIEVTPYDFEALPCTGVALRVSVQSEKDDVYRVSVTGIGYQYVDAPETYEASGTGHFYVYLNTPQAEGTYSIVIRVWNGELSSEREIRMVVTSKAGASAQGSGGTVTGLASGAAESGGLIYAILGIVIAAIFVAFFMRFYIATQQGGGKPGSYDFAALEKYDRDVKTAALS